MALKIKLLGLPKALTVSDRQFTQQLSKTAKLKATDDQPLRGGIGKRPMNAQEVKWAKERKERLEAQRMVQQILKAPKRKPHGRPDSTTKDGVLLDNKTALLPRVKGKTINCNNPATMEALRDAYDGPTKKH